MDSFIKSIRIGHGIDHLRDKLVPGSGELSESNLLLQLGHGSSFSCYDLESIAR